MNLEEKLHELCKNGELVHVSLASSSEGYRASFTAASPLGGYASGSDPDPVRALMVALTAPRLKAPRATKPRKERGDDAESIAGDDAGKPADGVTVTETKPEPPQTERSGRLRSYM